MNIKTSFRTRIIALSILTSATFVFSQCKKDTLDETLVESPATTEISEAIQVKAVAADGITSSSYYLVNSLPSGYVKDGSRDYTSYVQAAVSKYSNIVFPGFPIQVNDKGITIGSNKTITFQEGSQLRLKPTSNGGYNILNIYGVSNVTLYNPVIVGDRDNHIGTGGESGMGIGIRGSSNISIYSPNITNCWGDGIYIGQVNNSVNPKNIIIKDAYLRKNRRDGISVISADGLLLDNIYAGYTDGTAPYCGINFEPNNSKCEFKNIRINNPRTENNRSRGIQIGTRHLVGDTDKSVDITIVNHVDIGSTDNAFRLSVRNMDGNTGKMFGTLNIVNPSWRGTKNNVPLNLESAHAGFKTSISSPEIINTSGRTLTYAEAYKVLITQASRAPLTITEAIGSVTAPVESVEEPSNSTEPAPSAPSTNTSGVVFAVNAGGSAFTAANGITYSADKNYSGGSTYKSGNSISNTSDDALYQSERKGNFKYSIPVSKGTYEITFKMAEVYHKASGKRQFDVIGEGVSLISNMDIFSQAGSNKAYDVVRRITVNDGTLNLSFNTDIDNAKISAFHIIKE